jgi:hypothetical protein
LILIIIIPGAMAASYVCKEMLIDASHAAITDVISQDIRTVLAFGGWYYPAANWMPWWVVERSVKTVLYFTGVNRRVGEAMHQHIVGSWLDRLPARSIGLVRSLIARYAKGDGNGDSLQEFSPLIGDSTLEGFLSLIYYVLDMLYYRLEVACSAFIVGKIDSNNS